MAIAADQADASPPSTEAVFRAHGAQVSRWARSLAGPETDVEDLTQEVFTVVHARLRSFRGDSHLSTWLFGITANVVRRRRRIDRVRRWLGGSAQEVAGELPAQGPGAVEALERREARAKVYRVLEQMNERYRTAIILFELEDVPALEVAQLMGVKPTAIWVLLHRARADFGKRLQQLEGREE
ncbi:MAG: sigma-70 family RNA polymerase sigma factor [Myxococcales bacterium]